MTDQTPTTDTPERQPSASACSGGLHGPEQEALAKILARHGWTCIPPAPPPPDARPKVAELRKTLLTSPATARGKRLINYLLAEGCETNAEALARLRTATTEDKRERWRHIGPGTLAEVEQVLRAEAV